jgi:hypothetical protein
MHPHAPFDQRARYAALGKIDGEPDAHGSAADNDDLISLAHVHPRSGLEHDSQTWKQIVGQIML